jgi:hypothetical protein
VTHEHHANDEHPDGPEHDHTLPDADDIPGDLSAAGSDADPLEA